MVFDFNRKKAIVTGGVSGIGLAVASLLRDGGAEVVVIDRETDVTALVALEQAFERAGTPDIVIANAGIGSQAGLTETSDGLWDRTIAVNLTGVFNTLRVAARQ